MIGIPLRRVGVVAGISLFVAFVAALGMVMAETPAEAQTTSTAKGELVVVPNPVHVGQTTLALGYHVVPVNQEVAIEYSEHFSPDGEPCGGSPGVTTSASATIWAELSACTAGKAYVRLVDAATRAIITEVSVTVTGAESTTRQGGGPP